MQRRETNNSKPIEVPHVTSSKAPGLPTHSPRPPYLLAALPVLVVLCFPSDCFQLLRMSVCRCRKEKGECMVPQIVSKELPPANTSLHLQVLTSAVSLRFPCIAPSPHSSAHGSTVPSGWLATVGGHQENITSGWSVSWTRTGHSEAARPFPHSEHTVFPLPFPWWVPRERRVAETIWTVYSDVTGPHQGLCANL